MYPSVFQPFSDGTQKERLGKMPGVNLFHQADAHLSFARMLFAEVLFDCAREKMTIARRGA